MVKKKLYVILFILLLSLLLGISSNAYCYTFDEFTEFAEYCYDYNIITSTNKTWTGYFIANKNDIKSALENILTLDEYNSFYLEMGTNKRLYVGQSNSNTTLSYSGQNLNWNNATTIRKFTINYNSSTHQFQSLTEGTSSTSNSISKTTGLGLVESTSEIVWQTTPIMQNYYNYFDLLGAENKETINLPWYFANAKVAAQYYNENIHFDLYNLSDIKVMDIGAGNTSTILSGQLYQLEIPFTTGLVNGDYYYIKYNNNSTDFFKTQNFKISWTENSSHQSGTITNQSGDVTGSVDLSGIENRIDLTNQAIIEQTQAILSGDKKLRDAIISGDNQIISALTNTNFSGELTLENLPTIEIEDPSNEFFTWLMSNIQSTILYSGDSTLVIPIYEEKYEIRSDVFKLNIEPLKTFISIGWWFICGVPLLKWVRHIIETIRSGNIPQVDDKSDLLGNVL